MAVDLRSLLSLAGSRWFLGSRWTPPGLEVGCRRWCHCGGWHLPSPPISGATVSLHRTPEPPPGGTRAHYHHTGCCCRSSPFLVGRLPLPELRPTLYWGRSYCVVCACVADRYRFRWTLFFSCSLFLPPTRFLLLFSPFLSVAPAPRSPFPVLLYPVTAQFFGTLEAGVQKRHRHFRCTAELRIHTCTPCPVDRFGVDGACTHRGEFETVKKSKPGSVSLVARGLWPLSMANSKPLSLCPHRPHRHKLTNGLRSAEYY